MHWIETFIAYKKSKQISFLFLFGLALSGTCPKFAQENLFKYLLYHTSVADFRTTKNQTCLIRATKREQWQIFIRLLLNTLQITVLFSILTACSYQPLPRHPINSILDVFYWGNLGNNYLLASTYTVDK